MVVRYQPLDTLYCVRASYTLERNGEGDVVSASILNTANEGSVGGPPQNADMMRLRALIADRSGATPPSKLLVGPTFLPRFLYGPYWIVAVSELRANATEAGAYTRSLFCST
jgi:apolipoprotein D and lipocalin family protein